MEDRFKEIANYAGLIIEFIGIGVVLVVAVFVLLAAGRELVIRKSRTEIYHRMRGRLGRGILLGLEFLVAADIIQTVAVKLTFESVAVLGLIVIIRTVLSYAIEVEITGHWPWQSPDHDRKQRFTERSSKPNSGERT